MTIGKETIFLDLNWKPQSWADSSGKMQGIQVDIIQEIFATLQEEVDIQLLPWKRALLYSQKTESGIGTIYKTTERAKIYDYSAPLIDNPVYLYYLKNNAPTR